MPRFMSRLFGIAFLLAVIASPMMTRGAMAQEATPCPALVEEDTLAWVTAYYAAWNSHDSAQVTALYAPDAIHHWDIGIDSKGSEEFAASLDSFFAAFPGVRFTIDQVLIVEDTVVVRWIAIGIQEGEFMGIPGSLETVTWTGISILKLDCGLVTESWSESDHFGRLVQVGIIPTAPSAEATPTA